MNAKLPSHPPGIATRLLTWYDVHARDLPWRAKSGEAADAYRVWLSEIMLQQTTVATVRPRYAAWIARWPTLAALAAADEAEVMAAWAGLGYYARARNLIATARAVSRDHGGTLPDTEAALAALPGLGAYTAAAVAAIAFGRRAVVVDANVARVVARLFAVATPLPGAMPALRRLADTITPSERAGDFAQAMMDLGSSVCTPRAPRCLACPLSAQCAGFASGDPGAFPVKLAKRAKPERFATAYWLEHDNNVMLQRRPPRGLLGGMRALPTSPIADAPPALAAAPAGADWRLLEESVTHVFTHFRLTLALAVARGHAHDALASDSEWWPIDRLAEAGLPKLFAKAARTMERAR